MPEHTGFIVAAYAVTAFVMAGTIVAILMDYRTQRRLLAQLERRLPREGHDDVSA